MEGNQGEFRYVVLPQMQQQGPMYGGPRRVIPPQGESSEAEEKAWLEYMAVITEQEKMEVERLKIINNQEIQRVNQQVGNLYMQGLHEMREAMGSAKVVNGVAGVGEQRPLDKMFDEINDGRLQQRYFAMLDKYLEMMKVDIKELK